MLGIIFGTRNGVTRLGPLVRITPICSSMVATPPMPTPMITPTLLASSRAKSRPESLNASRAATTP